MADVNLFRYFPGSSFVHRLDPRIKLLGLIFLCIVTFLLHIPGLVMISGILIWAFALTNLPLKAISKQFRWMYILAGIILVSRLFTAPEGIPVFPRFPRMTWTGLTSGIEGAWRLALFVFLGILFISTTTVLQVRDGLYRVLKHVPLLPADTLSVMVSLTISFVPDIFSQTGEVLEAERARCIAGRRHPVQRLKLAVLPVIRNLLLRVDKIADAMESRAFSGTRTLTAMRMTHIDALAIGMLTAFGSAALLIDRVFILSFPFLVFAA